MLQSTTQKTKEHEHHKTRGYLWNGRQSLLHYWRTSYYAYLVSPGQHNQFVISEVVWTNKSVTNKNQRRTLKSNLVNGKIILSFFFPPLSCLCFYYLWLPITPLVNQKSSNTNWSSCVVTGMIADNHCLFVNWLSY
jgi:hypothetical protein